MTTSVETTQHHIPENLPTHLQHFIDGKFVDSIGGKTFDVQEPVSNENYATVASAQPEDVDLAVAAAKRAFNEGPWSKMLPRERSRVLHKIADIVESRDDELALLESYDSGLPITQAKGQARRAAENFRFFADLIVGQEDDAFKVPGRQINYVNRKPIGVAALITPWNVPVHAGVMEARPGNRDRQHCGHEAGQLHSALGCTVARDLPRGRPARRSLQPDLRLRRRRRRLPCEAPGRAHRLLHGRQLNRCNHLNRSRPPVQEPLARARRQEPCRCLRRRRHRGRTRCHCLRCFSASTANAALPGPACSCSATSTTTS